METQQFKKHICLNNMFALGCTTGATRGLTASQLINGPACHVELVFLYLHTGNYNSMETV